MLMKIRGPAARRLPSAVHKSCRLAFAFFHGCEGSSLPALLRVDLGPLTALAWAE